MTTAPTHRAPIAVAMDAPNLVVLSEWTRAVAPYVSTIKVGLEVFCRDGAQAVHTAREAAESAGGVDLFLDLKLHDIPATVAGAAAAVADLDPMFLTVHASGGAEMIEAAVSALPRTRITAVTVLTSLDAGALHAIGLEGTPRDAAVRLAVLAVGAGARAVVCSPQEVAAIRAAVGPEITLITPGVRPVGADMGDQKRVATPAQAISDGADLLVIGRPITSSAHPAAAVAEIAQSLSS